MPSSTDNTRNLGIMYVSTLAPVPGPCHSNKENPIHPVITFFCVNDLLGLLWANDLLGLLWANKLLWLLWANNLLGLWLGPNDLPGLLWG